MLDYLELLAENKALSEEVKKLRAENAELKAQLGIAETQPAESAYIVNTPQKNHLINKFRETPA